MLREDQLPKIRLHDLRHTHATLLLSAGVPLKAIQERLGHSSIVMTMDRYGHLFPSEDHRAVMDGIADELFG